MMALSRQFRALSVLSATLSNSASIYSFQSCHQVPQQASGCTLQQRQFCSDQGNQHRKASPSSAHVPINSYSHPFNWATLGLGSRSYSTQPRAVSAVSQAKTNTYIPVSLSSLTPGKRKYKRRRARGGGDKQAGRGYNGQLSRSGTGKPALFFEGGQTPFWKMLPKRGFTNNFRCEYDNVLLAELEAYIRAGKLDPTRVITVKHMYDAGLLEKKAYNRDGVQIHETTSEAGPQILAQAPSNRKASRLRGLINQEIPETFSIPVDLEVQRVSVRAREAIEAAGGRVTRTFYNTLGIRAVLLPEWFQKKGRLLPRAVQMIPYKKQWRFDITGSIPARDAPALEDMAPPVAMNHVLPPGIGSGAGGPQAAPMV